jgi:glutamine---fructose-6-phosphate transaminase (isomerizing)
MKHGPIALLTERYPVVALVPRDSTYDRMLANVAEARARGARVIAVCHEGDAEVARHATHVLPVPPTS